MSGTSIDQLNTKMDKIEKIQDYRNYTSATAHQRTLRDMLTRNQHWLMGASVRISANQWWLQTSYMAIEREIVIIQAELAFYRHIDDLLKLNVS